MKLCVKPFRKAIGKAIGVVAALLCFGTATALADSINLSEVTANTTVADGTTLTGTLGANVKISIADGATVTLKDVTITNLGNGCHWAGINCPGDAILVLEGANTVCAGGNSSGYHNYPGIWIAPEKTLTIQGDGSLVAYSGTGNAAWASGIGGGYEIDCGNIVIEGGTITATGGKSAAGIGCGYHAACGDIIINGGTITATGGRSSAGIGCGYEASCGNIVITGGTIASTGGMYSSALGGGYAASCGDITIAATVTSLTATSTPTSGAVSDCIGAGYAGGTCGTVTIGGVTGVVLESPYTFMPVDLSSVTEGTTIPNGATLCGTLAGNVKISIAPGATVTLGGANINGEGTWTDGDYAGITCEGNATIILRGENNVKGFNADYPGIYVPEGSTLTIQGGGALDASSNGAGAGIGGGNGISCGNIVIAGGVITATGGTGAAGIGGGSGAACGDITITDASFGVTATKGEDAPYSIGAGKDGSGGTVTIGNEVGAIEDSPYTCNLPIDLSNVTAARTIPDGKTITGTLGAIVKISIARNATVTLKDATINGVHNTDNYYTWSWAGITCEGDATIILEGENAVRGFCADYPGIFVPEGSTLTIQGEGSLDASSNGWGAGIGGGDGSEYYLSCGNIVIEGGTIVATGGEYAAAIGSGEYSDCGNIVIEGGTIVATGGKHAAAIGSGECSDCGTITIADSVTSVKAVKGEGADCSIGAGYSASCGTVTIGGTVYADGIAESPYIYPTYTATLKDGTEDADNWTITPNEGLSESNMVTVAYAGENKVKSVKAVAIPLTLSAATAEDVGKVVCADGHLHEAKTAVPDGCTAVGILGKVTETGHGLILALQDATMQTWNTINGWTSTTGYAGTTLKVLPDDAARGANLTSYIALGDTPVSDWAVGQKSDYEAIFINLGSTTGDEDGKVYDANVNDYITGVGGAAISDYYCSATEGNDDGAWNFGSAYWNYYDKASSSSVRPVLGFGGEAMEEITVTPVDGKTNEWTFVMPAADVVVEVEYFAVATFEVEGETYAVITNVVGKAVETPAEDPEKAGHSFAGWFTAATGGTKVTDETLMGAADTTFYAQFNEPILTIENGVLTAVDFNGCTNVALTIPDTVTTIGESAFYQCTGLAGVTIPGSVKTISHAAFRDCSNLTSVTIEEGVTTIGERAFARCVNLASITIPGTVTEIGEAAFSDCRSLTSLTIPGSVKTIGPQAFQNCTGLESVTIEEGVETIRRVAFDGCENLASVTIPDSVKEIGDDAFAGCSDALYEEGSGNLSGVKLVDGWAVGYDAGSISENLDLTGVRGIAGGAFAGCDVITSVIIPDGVATIPEYVFNGCDNLTSVTIPDSVTSIGEGAFGGCDNLASVTIPDSVTSIGKDAFEGCSEDLYDTTTIPGVALVDGWAIGYTDALPENLDLTGVRGIASMAFRESRLESVTIPGAVARVPASAFMSCSSLASVTLEEGVTAIDDSAFIECSALESVEIPDTVTAIGSQAFVACAKLASVTVPGSVAEIGPAAFGMCSSLTNVTLEAGVTNIGMMAFAMCSALESVEIPDTVTAIGSQAFLMSMNLASVTIPSSVMEIGQEAFAYTALATVKVSYGDGERVKEMLAASGFDVSKLTFVEPYKLTFDPNGGEFAEGVETNRFLYAGEEFGELPEATRTGHTFAGWLDENYNEVAATSKMGDADATVYAQWTINQYVITFDPAGGSDVAAITNDYGSAVTAPADPTKTGYTFSGWTPAVPDTIPASNTVCTAGWTVNQYTISFDVNGGEGEFDPVSLDYGAEYGELPAPVRTGYTFLGWFDGNGNEATAETVLGDADVALAARWGINRYTITFDSNGGTGGTTQTLTYNSTITAPTVTRTGYTFNGWSPVVAAKVPAQNVTYKAQWTVNKYTVTFDANGGTGGTTQTLTYNSTITAPTVTRTGYTFNGWSPVVAAKVPAQNVTYKAQWTANKYKVTFDANGGTGGTTQTLTYNSTITAPVVTRTGYTFNGWSPVVAAKVPAQNVTYKAQWTANKYTVTFDANGGTGGTTQTLTYNSTITAPTVTRTGYTFNGWSPVVAAKVPAQNVTYKAQWTVNKYTVTFDANGGTGGTAQTLTYNSTITAPTVARTGYTFKGWTPAVAAKVPAQNVTYKAQWTVNKYTVTFDANGGTGGTAQTLIYNSTITAPTVSRTGYTFKGWTPAVAAKVPAQNVTYKAQWTVNKYTVTFDANGGTGGTTQTLTYNSTITAPTVTRTGYEFNGWSPAVAAKVPAKDVAYTAQWKQSTYTITFDANGGTGGTSSEMLPGTALVRPEVECGGMVFAGWDPVPPAVSPASNATYVAQWVAPATPTWETQSVEGGVAIKSCSYPYGEIVIPAEIGGRKIVEIQNYAFFGNSGITSLVIPDGVKTIGIKAFKGCSNLMSVKLPAGLKTLGQAAFQDCASLTEVDVPAGIDYLWSSTFEGCTALKRASLPEGITAIGTSSFANCKALTEVNIPTTVKTIKSFAFFSCENLADVTLPENLATIEQKAFKNCTGMEAIEIPTSVKTLGKAAFFNTGLVEATVPGGIAKVDDYCFQKCAALKKMTLGEGVTTTGASVWANDEALEEVVFPKTLQTLGGYAFFRCYSLTTLWNFSDMSALSTLGEKTFRHCTSLKSLSMPSHVTTLPKEMCNYCAALEKVSGTANVTSIGQSAFSNCPALKSVAGLDAAALKTVKAGKAWAK